VSIWTISFCSSMDLESMETPASMDDMEFFPPGQRFSVQPFFHRPNFPET
jgi:hypothetical protein